MKTKELLSYIQLQKIVGEIPEEITGIQTDSRKVERNNIFVCINGYTVDGHDFIEKAIEKGASVIVTERDVIVESDVCIIKVGDTNRAISILANAFYGFPSNKLNIIGVTGTNGKTTVSSVIHQVLMKAGIKAGLSGTVGINYNGHIEESSNTTNDALTVQRMLKRMEDEGITDVVMEVSSHGLVLGRLWGVEFQQGLFTNLTQDHLDFHGTMEHYKQAKGLLFAQLGQNIQNKKTAILNSDDDATELYKTMTSAKVITYGIQKNADYMAMNIRMSKDFTEFTLKCVEGEFEVKTSFVGMFNIYNLLSAIVALVERGMKIKEIIHLLESSHSVGGRMERIPNNKNRAVFVDFAHTPDGIEKVLQSVKAFTKGKVIIVFGTGGNRDATKRPIMAKKASEYADLVVITTDNPRFEEPESIMDDMVKGMEHNNYVRIADRKEAIRYAIENSHDDDIVVIAGKGHETYQIIGDTKYPFSDKDEAIKVLNTLL